MANYLVGIDFGTGGAKAAVIDHEGNDLGGAFEEYPLVHEHAGWSEHDAGNYWNVACRIIRQSIERAGADAKLIRGVDTSQGRAGGPVRRATARSIRRTPGPTAPSRRLHRRRAAERTTGSWCSRTRRRSSRARVACH